MLSPLTRDETILVLNALGVDIPADTKLVDDILEKRLSDALGAAQYKDRLPEFARHNIDEAHKLYADFRAGKNTQNALFVDPFVDLRHTMTEVAKFLDLGIRWCLLQDEPNQESAILLRFLTVLEVNEKLPVLVVLYRTIDRVTGASGADWAILQARSNPPHLGHGFHSVKATLLEQKLLLKILKANNSLVPPDYNVARGPLEDRFEVSALLPIGPLEYDALSKLNNNMGCTSRTAAPVGCPLPNVSFPPIPVTPRSPVPTAIAACQRADWAEHKPACRSLQDATWRTIRLRAGYPGMEDCWFGLFNCHTSLALPAGADPVHKWFLLDDARPCVDVYGGRPFLAKMQISSPGVAPGHIMVYDRRQMLLGFLREDVDPRAFAECVVEMRGPRGGLMGRKMYRWVRRTGNWELSVCLDRAPAVNAKCSFLHCTFFFRLSHDLVNIDRLSVLNIDCGTPSVTASIVSSTLLHVEMSVGFFSISNPPVGLAARCARAFFSLYRLDRGGRRIGLRIVGANIDA
ncbi:hypothetical protein V8D89_001032 [Ganoderma adspersum]